MFSKIIKDVFIKGDKKLLMSVYSDAISETAVVTRLLILTPSQSSITPQLTMMSKSILYYRATVSSPPPQVVNDPNSLLTWQRRFYAVNSSRSMSQLLVLTNVMITSVNLPF